MNAVCSTLRPLLELYAEGELLRARDLRRVRRHLGRCAACRDWLESRDSATRDLFALGGLLGAEPGGEEADCRFQPLFGDPDAEAAAERRDRLVARLETGQLRTSGVTEKRRGHPGWLQAAAAFLILTAVFHLVVFDGDAVAPGGGARSESVVHARPRRPIEMDRADLYRLRWVVADGATAGPLRWSDGSTRTPARWSADPSSDGRRAVLFALRVAEPDGARTGSGRADAASEVVVKGRVDQEGFVLEALVGASAVSSRRTDTLWLVHESSFVAGNRGGATAVLVTCVPTDVLRLDESHWHRARAHARTGDVYRVVSVAPGKPWLGEPRVAPIPADEPLESPLRSLVVPSAARDGLRRWLPARRIDAMPRRY